MALLLIFSAVCKYKPRNPVPNCETRTAKLLSMQHRLKSVLLKLRTVHRNLLRFCAIQLFTVAAFETLGSAVAAKMGDEVRTDGFERDDAACVTLQDGGTWHTGHHAGVFTLRHGETAGSLDRAETFRAVFAHAGHENANRGRAKFLRDGMKQDIDGRAVAVDVRGVAEHGDVTAGHATDHHVAISRTDKNTSGEK